MTTSPADPAALAVVDRSVSFLTRRDIVRPLFRHGRRGLIVFACTALLASIAAALWPTTYQAQMKILVKRERIDPVLSADRDVSQQARLDVSEADLYSEVELLQSRDLLESVALAAKLVPPTARDTSDHLTLARAVKSLQSHLSVALLKKTALIQVTYRAGDPTLAARVLSELARLYLEKHFSVHRPAAARQFFNEQTSRLRGELESARSRLVDFSVEQRVVAAASERDNALQRLSEFESTRAQLRAQLADVDRRVGALQQQMAATPERQVTLLRTQDNGELIRELTSKVLTLELKHTELSGKFEPKYPPLIEVVEQLQQARAALRAAQQEPVREEVTDQNPTHQWLRGEIVRVQAEREAVRARLHATEETISRHAAAAQEFARQDSVQQELIRAVKTAEDNVALYEHKAEEARISDALDATRIGNVAIAEAATVPSLPSGVNRWLLLINGLVIAVILGIASTFALEVLNPRFRSRDEFEQVLDLPVLATLPAAFTSE